MNTDLCREAFRSAPSSAALSGRRKSGKVGELPADKSGAEATAVQTLREFRGKHLMRGSKERRCAARQRFLTTDEYGLTRIKFFGRKQKLPVVPVFVMNRVQTPAARPDTRGKNATCRPARESAYYA
jgi:hypothetical protein